MHIFRVFKNFIYESCMLSIQNKKPLVYRHPLSHLVTSMPYIDSNDLVPKSVLNYMIKTEANEIPIENQNYLSEFPLPKTPFLDSPQFEELVRVAQSRKKPGKKNLSIPTFDVSNKVDPETLKKQIQVGEQNIEYNFYRNPNLDITSKLGPLVLKEHINYLDTLRDTLNLRIYEQKQQIEELNAKRKYEQLENKERLDTINDRIKMLLVAGQSSIHQGSL